MSFKDLICPNCEDYFLRVLNSMSEGVAMQQIICDESGKAIDFKYLEINTAFEKITGLKRKDVIGRKAREIFPDMEPYWIESFGKVALSGTTENFEIFLDGLNKFLGISAFQAGENRFVTLLNDITQLKLKDDMLKKHKLFLECAQDAVLYTKADGAIVEANTAAVEKYGYTYEELLKLNIKDLRHASTMMSFEEEMKLADTGGILYECIQVKKDGTSFHVEVSAASRFLGEERVRIHIIRDITERKKTEDKIMYLANYDSLTSIPNRGFLMKQLDLALERAHMGGYKLALMLFDIDKFKVINDIYGHQAGDIILKEMVARTKTAIRKTDIIGRLGGDEFIVILPYIEKPGDASFLARRILKKLEKPVNIGENELNLNISIGISIYPDDADNKSGIIHSADTAMYATKGKGGKGFEFFSCISSLKKYR